MKRGKMEENRKREQFAARVHQELAAFKRKILSKSKAQIYEDAFRIYFYQELTDYLTNPHNIRYLDDEILRETEPLTVLWGYYLKQDWIPIGGEDNLYQLVEDFCAGERRTA